jgi:hypothetical protein
VYAAEDRESSPPSHHTPQFIASVRIAGMNSDSDNVAGMNALRLKLLDRFIDNNRIAK